jgi:hypothetical protein
VKRNLRFVISVAKKYQNRGNPGEKIPCLNTKRTLASKPAESAG